MNERNRTTEQLDADTPSKEKTGIHVRIELGKRFFIFAVALVILVAGVFLAARFVPRDTPVGVYRAPVCVPARRCECHVCRDGRLHLFLRPLR